MRLACSSIGGAFPWREVLPAGNASSIPLEHLPAGNGPYHGVVKIEDVRQQNLRRLLEQHKTKAALAKTIGVDPSYLSRLLSGGKNRKRLKEDLAREIEKFAGLPPLSLDHGGTQQPDPLPSWPFSFSRARIERLHPKDREKIDQAITIMLSLCEGTESSETKKRAA